MFRIWCRLWWSSLEGSMFSGLRASQIVRQIVFLYNMTKLECFDVAMGKLHTTGWNWRHQHPYRFMMRFLSPSLHLFLWAPLPCKTCPWCQAIWSFLVQLGFSLIPCPCLCCFPCLHALPVPPSLDDCLFTLLSSPDALWNFQGTFKSVCSSLCWPHWQMGSLQSRKKLIHVCISVPWATPDTRQMLVEWIRVHTKHGGKEGGGEGVQEVMCPMGASLPEPHKERHFHPSIMWGGPQIGLTIPGMSQGCAGAQEGEMDGWLLCWCRRLEASCGGKRKLQSSPGVRKGVRQKVAREGDLNCILWALLRVYRKTLCPATLSETMRNED